MTHLSDKEVLQAAIEKALERGWKFQPFGERYFPNYIIGSELVKHIAETINDLRLDVVLFNHDFAKALWGDGDPTILPELPGTPTRRKMGSRTVRYKNWKYHIRQMVLAEDRIDYLRRHGI